MSEYRLIFGDVSTTQSCIIIDEFPTIFSSDWEYPEQKDAITYKFEFISQSQHYQQTAVFEITEISSLLLNLESVYKRSSNKAEITMADYEYLGEVVNILSISLTSNPRGTLDGIVSFKASISNIENQIIVKEINTAIMHNFTMERGYLRDSIDQLIQLKKYLDSQKT